METPSVAIEEIFETEAPVVFNPVGRGGKVAFISDRQGDGYKQVWVMEVGMDGNNNPVAQNFEQITFSPNDKSNPSWSPDGTKLIYSGLSTEFSANGSPFAADIWIIDLTQPEQEPIDISRRPGDDFYAAWSPNGKHIAFTSYYREDKTPQHVLMNPDGSNQTLLSILGFSDTYSTWSPNGDWLLYVFSTGNLKVLQMRYQSDFINNVRKFDQSSNEGRLGNVIEPSISSDGSMIAYTRVLDNAKTNIYTAVFADRGRTVTQMTDSGMDYAPCWSPDGKWILFTSERDGDPEIYIMDSEGGQIANLSQMPSIDSQPSWQPPKSNRKNEAVNKPELEQHPICSKLQMGCCFERFLPNPAKVGVVTWFWVWCVCLIPWSWLSFFRRSDLAAESNESARFHHIHNAHKYHKPRPGSQEPRLIHHPNM